MSQIVYRYGLHHPDAGVEEIYRQFQLSHRYRNTLIEIERGRRAAMRAVEMIAGDLPAIMLDLRDAQDFEEESGKAVARHRAASRKRDEPREMREAITQARARTREIKDRARAVRKAINTSPTVQAAKDRIGELAKGLANNAYEYSGGLYWGQRAVVDEAAAESFADLPMYDLDWKPNDPHFERRTGDGTVALQIMKRVPLGPVGISVEALHACTDTRVRLRAPDARAWSGARSDRRAYGSTAYFQLRIGTDADRKPVYGGWVCDMPRPLPENARIVWATVRRKAIGPHSEWYLCLTLDLPEGAYAMNGVGAPTVGGAVAVDVGWRQLPDGGLRVAGWLDEHGTRGELVLPPKLIKQLHHPEDVRSERDLRFDTAREAIARVVAALAKPPEWLPRNIRQWKAPAKLASLCRDWPEEPQGAVLDAAYRDLCTWYYRDKHLWAVEAHSRLQSLRARQEVYRIFGARLASQYDTIVIERFDKRVFARRPVIGSEQDVAQNETARGNRQLASTSNLVGAIIGAGRSRCRTVAAVSAVDTTRACPSCGLVVDRDAAAAIRLVCECGHAWDQDVDGAPKLLLQRWREQPGEAKMMVAAREEKKENEDGVVQESRWAKVKRLRAEKLERMKVAREAEEKVAE